MVHYPAVAELHGGHPGITHMKPLARELVWWPNLDGAIEDLVKQCKECQQSRATPPQHPFIQPTHPKRRIHIDFVEGRQDVSGNYRLPL